MTEHRLYYPTRWEAEYKRRGLVRKWLRDYPSLYRPTMAHTPHPKTPSSRLKTLDLFAQYALQYLLREQEIHSITWYTLANVDRNAKNRRYIDKCWIIMRRVMKRDFSKLQRAIREARFKDFSGEPDLFCWDTKGHWFFAEAKRLDRLGKHQKRWFGLSRRVLGRRGIVRVYRLVS